MRIVRTVSSADYHLAGAAAGVAFTVPHGTIDESCRRPLMGRAIPLIAGPRRSQVHRRAGGSRRSGGRARPQLDETQRALNARLEGGLEFWQTAGSYEAERHQDPPDLRRLAGVELAKRVPQASHAEWKPPKNRPSPVDMVVAGNAGRVAELVPLRMGRMAASPFAFLRGAASVMAWDLSHTPVSGPEVVIDGDAHINNFGLFGTPQREVIVDMNDFDEATRGPWEWDLKRLVASVNVAGRENGLNRKERRRAVSEAAFGYRWNINRLWTRGVLDVWSLLIHADRKPGVVKVPNKAWAIVQKTVSKAQRTTNETLLPKVAHRRHDGGWRFVDAPPILTRVDDETRGKVVASLAEYADSLSPAYRYMLRRYAVADVAHRVVGVGSVGMRAYLVLMFGNGDNDPLFLQVKEAGEPVHAQYLPPLPIRLPHQGRRVVVVQRLLQASGDPMLGHTTIDGRPFYVRQMKNMKASLPVQFMTGEPFEFWAFACGALLARAHARSGDAAKIAGYCGDGDGLDRALVEFAESYGDQTERDHAELVRAIKNGRVRATAGDEE
jgi:uncharacterized protein (DUF2252 family)